MTKLALSTHIPAKCAQDELAHIAHDGHQLPARRLTVALDQDRRGQNLALGPPGEPALERFECCEQSACNSVDGDTGESVAP
jgi:hypothetical protein